MIIITHGSAFIVDHHGDNVHGGFYSNFNAIEQGIYFDRILWFWRKGIYFLQNKVYFLPIAL